VSIAIVVASQVMVMFLLMGLGVVATRRGLLTVDAAKTFANFLLVIVMPSIIVKSFQRPFVVSQLQSLGLAFLLAIIFHLVAIIVSYLLIGHRDDPNFRVERMAAIYSNCSFMGIPMLYAVLGDDGVFYGVAFMGVFNILTWTNGVLTLMGRDNKIKLLKMIFNPGTIGLIIGMLLYFTNTTLPSVFMDTITFVSNLNTPLAMIIVGAMLHDVNLLDAVKDINIHKLVWIRILILPLLMIGIVLLLNISSWFENASVVVVSNIIAAACPTAVSAILMVSKFNMDSQHGSKAVAISTILSIITMPSLVALANYLI